MIKKTFIYENFEGVQTTTEFRFHLSKIELAEKEILSNGEYRKRLMRISESSEASEVYPLLKDFILDSVGQVSADGSYFEKSPEIQRKFEQCGAYEMLVFEVLGDAKEAAAFLNGIMPAALVAEANALIASGKDPSSLVITPEGERKKEASEYTREELLALTDEQFDNLVGTNPRKMTQEQMAIAYMRFNRKN